MDRLEEFFKGMVEHAFNSEEAAGWNVVLQYHITGDGGGNYYIVIENGECTLHRGVAESPSLTITAHIDDWFAIASGRTNGREAFFDGRMSVTGDINHLFRMQSVFAKK